MYDAVKAFLSTTITGWALIQRRASMRKTVIHLLLFTLILLPLLPTLPVIATGGAAPNTSVDVPDSGASTASQEGVDTTPPAINLALANYTSNRIENGGFESWSNAYTPEEWSSEASGDTYTWFAQSPWPVYETSYSMGIQCRTPYDRPSEATWYQDGLSVDMRDLNLTFQYYIDKNEDPATDYFYVRLSLYNNSDSWRMYYYLNGTTGSTNSSWNAYFLLKEPAVQWNRFCRNITDDFVSVSEFPGTVDATLGIQEIRFYGYASGDSTDHLRAFVDDVNVVNETNAYVWIGGATNDGNFESGTKNPWEIYWNLDAGSLYQSSDVHSGSWSVNTTAISLGNESVSNVYCEPEARLTSQNQGVLRFWWNLSYQNVDPTSHSFVLLQCTTGVGYREIYYYLGYGGTGYPALNNTLAQLVYRADSFNETAGWNHFQRNIWNDAASFFSTDEIFIDQIFFYSKAESSGSAITTLIDDVAFVSRAINDGNYEDQQGAGSSIRGWDTENSYFTVTDSYYFSGSKAANLTVPTGENWNISQPLHGRPLNGTRETYLDVMWRLENYTAPDEICLELVLDDGKVMRYYMAATTLPANGTTAYFNETGVGTTSTWMTMHRDLNHDYEAAFGGLPNTKIESISLRDTSTSGGQLQLILDDLYLYDDNAPYITNVGTTLVTHDQQVNVTADVYEQDLDTLLFHYRVSSGAWQNSTMLLQSGDTYNSTIPGQANGTFVEYFITANDTWPMETIALDNGFYWNYTVTDKTPPSVSSVGHTPSPVMYTDIVDVSADADDVIAGVKNVSFYYRVNGGTWQETIMSFVSGTTYQEQIPAQAWNVLVEYYINATDNKNNSRIDDNSGSYYSYIVGDNVNPVISISTPTGGSTISGSVDVTALASDPGSGIQRVEFRANGILVLNDTTFPYVYFWNTPDTPNGAYILNVTVWDVVGNTASDSITVTVNNVVTTVPPPGIPPLLLITFAAIGVIVAFAVIVTFYAFIRRR